MDRPHVAQAAESEKELDQADNGDADDSVITKLNLKEITPIKEDTPKLLQTKQDEGKDATKVAGIGANSSVGQEAMAITHHPQQARSHL